MIDYLVKIFRFIIEFSWPKKLIELQVKIHRLNVSDPKQIQDFIDIYEETFPYDGSNYTSGELLEIIEDIHNSKKHVVADNIVLVAEFKNTIVGFVACFYYPEKEYGIIGYFGKTKTFREEGKIVGISLLKRLKKTLLEEYNCRLLIFELELHKRSIEKSFLFKSYAKLLGLDTYEVLFDYYRPKFSLDDPKQEENLLLFLIPIREQIKNVILKDKLLEILTFLHLYCYGDYYSPSDKLHSQYMDYMQLRINHYKKILPDVIELK